MNVVGSEGPVELLKVAVNVYGSDEYCFHSTMQFILVLLIKLYSSNCLTGGGSAAASIATGVCPLGFLWDRPQVR